MAGLARKTGAISALAVGVAWAGPDYGGCHYHEQGFGVIRHCGLWQDLWFCEMTTWDEQRQACNETCTDVTPLFSDLYCEDGPYEDYLHCECMSIGT